MILNNIQVYSWVRDHIDDINHGLGQKKHGAFKEQFITDISTNTRNISLTNTTTFNYDGKKLIMVQNQLTDCVKENQTSLKCIEEIYNRERHAQEQHRMKLAIPSNKRVAAMKISEQIKQTAKKPDNLSSALSKKKIDPRVKPTDDPMQVDEFYRRKYKIVNEYKYKYMITPKQSCNHDTYMVILVHSFHPYYDRRTAIRSTWGGAATGSHMWPRRTINKKVKLFFILGTHPLISMNSEIQKESKQYDDIIQGNFFDAYVNMTLKSLLGLKYVSEYCKDVKYMFKSDDDMIVNIPYLLEILEQKQLHRSIMGPLNTGSMVFRVGKWKINARDFPFISYPPYESGSGYVITNDIVRELYNASHYVRYFHVDDAYITGVLGKIIQVNHEKQKGFAFWTDKAPVPCDIINNAKITGTKMTPKKLMGFWHQLHKDFHCS